VTEDSTTDVVIVGGGIVGLATAWTLHRQHPGITLALIEKEQRVAAHQTGHNSGVIHSGIYYKPGSLKARTVAAGRTELIEFCREYGVDHEICGKVIVATKTDELDQLDALNERAAENGVPSEKIDRARLRELEPHVEGLAALHVTSAGIVDFVGMCEVMAEKLIGAEADLRLGTEVVGLSEQADEVIVDTTRGSLRAKVLVNCGGLQSDKVAGLAGPRPDGIRIMPFRGEYYGLVPERRDLVRNLIYPVPDPRFPFLGVHYTRMIDGDVHAGPNAVAAFKREGYGWKAFDRSDAREILAARSSWTLARKYWRTGIGEMRRSISKTAFVKALQELIPAVRADDLVKGHAGVRAQAMAPDGTLLDDFAIGETARMVHVINAPSPAATASLDIGRTIAAKVTDRLGEQ